MNLITLPQAAAHTGLSRSALSTIMKAGLLPMVVRHGRTRLIPTDVAQQLKARPAAALHHLLPTAAGIDTMPVLRVDVAKPVHEEDRPFIGFHADLSPEDLLEALRGWWTGKPEKISQTGILPVTLGGFVVAVLTGLGDWESKRTDTGVIRHRFDANLVSYISDLDTPVNLITTGTADDRRISEVLLGKHLESNSGGPIAYVSARPVPPPELPQTAVR